ncbi:MAG TPA: alpha/beta hydrolase [Candidatus Elarobacter sp.]|jgi:alpha-beta hydrolase superfamily lysophospholipase|nr:alpha/beta hydrolase [Candidatus Elarobacter sp.]
MNDAGCSSFSFENDGSTIVVDRVLPEDAPKAAVIVAHGMAEHAERYARFAGELAAHGYAAYAPDHRGHGRTAGSADRFGWAGADGWNGIVRDLERLAAIVRARHPGVPLFLFGHSMGSMLAQRFAQLHGDELAGMILSGTTGSAPNLGAGIAAASAVRLVGGDRAPSPLQRVMFADFNKPFEHRTGFEWLSRDDAEVQKYVGDPRCGFTFSNRLMLDMLRGYAEAWKPANERRIPPSLPVLMFSGARDPVGGAGKAVAQLAERYRALGLSDVRVVIYPDARHETLNETNRDEVVRDVLAWLDAHTELARQGKPS